MSSMSGLESWDNRAIVPQKKLFSQLEEEFVKHEEEERERRPIQHYTVPRIQTSGMGYSSLEQMDSRDIEKRKMLSGMLPGMDTPSRVYEKGLESWDNRAIVPQKKLFSQLEEEFVKHEDEGRERRPIQHYTVPRIQTSGMGYSSLEQMTNFCLALPRAANPDQRINDGGASILNRALIASSLRGVEEPPEEEEAQSMQLVEGSTLLEDSQIQKKMSEADYREFSKIFTLENREHFLRSSRTIDPLCNLREMTPALCMKFLYFLVFIRYLTLEKAAVYLKILSKYYACDRNRKDFTRSCNVWEYRHYRPNDCSIPPSHPRFVSACYLVFLALRMLWVFEAIARGNELLDAKERDRLVTRFSSSSSKILKHFRGYWEKEYAADLLTVQDNRQRVWKPNRRIKGTLHTELAGLKRKFNELADSKKMDEDRTILSEIRKKLHAVTCALNLESISKMLKKWRIRVRNKKTKEV